MVEKKPRELWTLDQVACYLQLSKSTIYQLVGEKKLPCIKVGKQLRFFPDDVERALKRMTA